MTDSELIHCDYSVILCNKNSEDFNLKSDVKGSNSSFYPFKEQWIYDKHLIAEMNRQTLIAASPAEVYQLTLNSRGTPTGIK